MEVSLAAHGAGLHLVAPPTVELGAEHVRVTITGRVDFVFVPAVPGNDASELVTASATAALEP